MVQKWMEFSLEEIVSLIKVPPWIRGISEGEVILKPGEREKFSLLKKNYEDSLKRVLSYDEKNLPHGFRFFLRRYDSYFGASLFPILEDLDNQSINYIVGSLKFEKNVKKFKEFIPTHIPDYTH